MQLSEIGDFGQLIAGLAFDSMHVLVIGFCVLTFMYLSRTIENSRFVQNLASAWGAMGCSYIGKMITAIIAYLVVTRAGDASSASSDVTRVYAVWHAMDSVISLGSTYFLFRAAHMVRHYPTTQLTKDWASASLGILTLVVSVSIASIADKSGSMVFVVGVVDVLAAAIGILGLGWALHSLSLSSSRQLSAQWVRALRWGVLVAFSAWGLLQMPFLLVLARDLGWKVVGVGPIESNVYYAALMVAKFASAMSAVILVIEFLEDKPQWRHPATGSKRANRPVSVQTTKLESVA